MPPLVIASASPRREALLKQICLEFEVEPSNIEEPLNGTDSPEQLALSLAGTKARLVASGRSEGLVIGADTLVVLNRTVLGKPEDAEDAKSMLRLLSGKEHSVITGLAVVDAATGRVRADSVTTLVKFAPLDPDIISRYVATGEPVDKAGAYAIQGCGALLVESIRGCYYNVMGLPLRRLAEMLAEFGYESYQMGID